MPVIVEGPDGARVEFPDGTSPEVMRDAMRKHYGFKAQAADPVLAEVQARRDSLHVPLSGIEDTMTAEQEAAGRRASMDAAAQQQAIDAARSPGQRIADTATFAASMPVRMATRGEYGAGDVAGAIGGQEMAQALRQRESDFARNNAPGLEMMAAAGEIGAGIPALGTMGAAPRSMLTQAARAARNPIASARSVAQTVGELPGAYAGEAKALGGEIQRVMSDTSGAIRLPGAAGGVPPAPAAPPAPPTRMRQTITDDDAIAAAARLGIDMPRAVGGGAVARSMAGPLAAIPYAGRPVERAYQRGLMSLGGRLDEAVENTGTPGAAIAGGDIKASAVDWIRNRSATDLHDEYAPLAQMIPRQAMTQMPNTRRAAQQMRNSMAESTSKTPEPALRIVEDALERGQGLTFNGLKKLRTDVGARLDSAAISPEPGTSIPALKQIYAAMTKDIEAMAAKHGAGEAFERATTRAREVARVRDELQKIVGRRGDVSPEGVTAKVQQIAGTRGTANAERLQLLKENVSPESWGNIAAEFMSRLGRDPKDGRFSAARYTTDYGKYSDAAKTLLFGEAKNTLDDLVTVARQYEALESKFNRSNTGSVNALMEYILKPGATAGAIGAAIAAPAATASAALVGGSGLLAGRRMAHYLAQPVVAGTATKLLKAHMQRQAALAANRGSAATGREAVAAAASEYAQARSAATGEDVGSIRATLARMGIPSGEIDDIIRGTPQ